MKPVLQRKLEEAGYTNIHGPEKCAGQRCMIHNPTPHHMLGWPLDLRLDKGGPAERRCPHGIGHPDPDSLVFVAQFLERGHAGVHGCDGCCRADQKS